MMPRSNKRLASKKRRFSRRRFVTPLSKGVSNFLGKPTKVSINLETPVFIRFVQANQLGQYSYAVNLDDFSFDFGGALLANNPEFAAFDSRFAYFSYYGLEVRFVPGTVTPSSISPTLNSFPTIYFLPTFSCDNPVLGTAADSDQALMCRIGDLGTSSYSKFYAFPGTVFNNVNLLPIAGSQAILPCGQLNPTSMLLLLGSKTLISSRLVDGNATISPIIGYVTLKLYFNFYSAQPGNLP